MKGITMNKKQKSKEYGKSSGNSHRESGTSKVSWSGKFGIGESEVIERETEEDACLPGHMERFSVLICSLAYCPRMPCCDAISVFSGLQIILCLIWPKASLKPDMIKQRSAFKQCHTAQMYGIHWCAVTFLNIKGTNHVFVVKKKLDQLS